MRLPIPTILAFLALADASYGALAPPEKIKRADTDLLVPITSILEEGAIFESAASRFVWLKLWRYHAAPPLHPGGTGAPVWKIDVPASLRAFESQGPWYAVPPSLCPTFAPLKIDCGR